MMKSNFVLFNQESLYPPGLPGVATATGRAGCEPLTTRIMMPTYLALAS